MKVNLNEGQALVLPKKKKSFNPSQIPGAVKAAGFTPGEMELTAVGKLTTEGGVLRLEMEGPLPVLRLSGGTKAKVLRSQRDLIGKTLRITGIFEVGKKGEPPELSVMKWKIVPPS